MKTIKKVFVFLFVCCVFIGVFRSENLQANESILDVPTFSLKLTNKKTGVKIVIDKTKDADGYEINISGVSQNDEACGLIKYKNVDGQVYLISPQFTYYFNKSGKAKRSYNCKNLQPGTYVVKIRSWNTKKSAEKTYSEWSEEKSFTLKEASTKGYDTSYDFSTVKKGDIIKFGCYEQDLNYTNGKEPIEWIVIEKTKKSILLLSRYALERMPFNKEFNQDVTWETSTIRKWLNNEFLKNSFNKVERKMIKSTTLKNNDNYVYNTDGGNDTKDKVFLLSQQDLVSSKYGFSDNSDECDINRRCAFVWDKDKKESGDKLTKNNEPVCSWWLRTPGESSGSMCYVAANGSIIMYGLWVSENGGYNGTGPGVRPAMYISLCS